MLSTLVSAQALQSSSTQRIGGQHTLHSQHHCLVGLLGHQGFVLNGLHAADPAAVMIVVLIDQLVAGQNGLVAVDDDNVIAAVNIRRKGNLVLTAQQNSSGSSNAAQGLACGVDDVPFALYFTSFCKCGAHGVFLLNWFYA